MKNQTNTTARTATVVIDLPRSLLRTITQLAALRRMTPEQWVAKKLAGEGPTARRHSRGPVTRLTRLRAMQARTRRRREQAENRAALKQARNVFALAAR